MEFHIISLAQPPNTDLNLHSSTDKDGKDRASKDKSNALSAVPRK